MPYFFPAMTKERNKQYGKQKHDTEDEGNERSRPPCPQCLSKEMGEGKPGKDKSRKTPVLGKEGGNGERRLSNGTQTPYR